MNMTEENRRKESKANIFAVAIMVVAAIALLGSTASFASCTANDDNAASLYEQTTFIPPAPDYNDAAMWVTSTAASPGSTASVWRRTSKSGPKKRTFFWQKKIKNKKCINDDDNRVNHPRWHRIRPLHSPYGHRGRPGGRDRRCWPSVPR